MSYISSAELARRCDVSRAAVTIAIREHRIDPAKVRRAGGRVLVEQAHGFSVLGHHAKSRPSPSPRPASPAADEFTDLLAWGAAPIMQESEPDELTGAAEVADLLEQINQWDELVKEKETLLAWWKTAYTDFRRWVQVGAVTVVMQTVEEHPAARHAACETVAAVLAQLRAGLDDVDYATRQ